MPVGNVKTGIPELPGIRSLGMTSQVLLLTGSLRMQGLLQVSQSIDSSASVGAGWRRVCIRPFHLAIVASTPLPLKGKLLDFRI